MEEIKINKISVFLSTEINEIFSKTIINETYISPNIATEIKIIFYIYNNSILKSFKILLGKELFISNEYNNKNQIIENKNENNFLIEYDSNKEYCFTINLGKIKSNTVIEINSVYLNFMQNEGNQYVTTLFKRYPMILIQEENKNKYSIYEKIEGEILLNAQYRIGSFNINTINFNEDYIYKENIDDNNEIREKISFNILRKQYNRTKELYIKYNLIGLQYIREYIIYENMNDFLPIFILTFTSLFFLLLKNNIEDNNNSNNQKIFLFTQKIKEDDNKEMNFLHYKYLFNNKNINNNIFYNNNDIIFPNKYLFVIDESVSMAGKIIAKIRGALKLLLYSLNNNCEYQIIGFNESIKLYDGKFKHAVKSNIVKSLEYISNIFVDNKKCNLFQIINLIYYICNKNKNIPINIFLFTNAICDKIEINKSLNIIYKNSLQKNFHLNIFSLGQKYNKYFVTSGSILGNGNYHCLSNINKLNKEVISELSNCFQEYYSNINADISKSIILKEFNSENISQINISNNNPLNLCFISKIIENKQIIKFKIYFKKYLNGKFLLQNTIFKNYEICNISLGDDLYLLYLYKLFFENNYDSNENIIKEDINSSNFLDKNYFNLFDFSLFLKKSSSKYGINFNNIEDIYYYDNNSDNNILLNKNILNSKNKNEYNIENYKDPNNEDKDYFDIFPLTEKKYHDFLLVDDIIDYSEFAKNEKNIKKINTQRKKSYGKMMIGGIYKGVGKFGNSIAILGKNIGNSITHRKQNKNKEKNIDKIKSESISIKKIQKDEDDLEDNAIDNYIGNKYGYEKNDEFIMNTVFSQDIEGFWDYGNKKLDKIIEKYKEMSDVVEIQLKEKYKNDKLNVDMEKILNIKMTFIMIVFLMKEYKDRIYEFSFIINKSKNFLLNNGYEFDSIVNDIGVIFE